MTTADLDSVLRFNNTVSIISFLLIIFSCLSLVILSTTVAIESWANSSNLIKRKIVIWYYKLYTIGRNRKIVCLLDYNNKRYITVAHSIADSDQLESWVHYRYKIGPIRLNSDGTVSRPDGSEYFIYNWLPINVEERTWMILQGARGFDHWSLTASTFESQT